MEAVLGFVADWAADTVFELVIDDESGNEALQQDFPAIEPMTCGRLLDDLLPDPSIVSAAVAGHAAGDESEDELEIIPLGFLDEIAAGCEDSGQPL